MAVIVIVDYGMGNLRSILNKFERMEVEAKISSDPSEIERVVFNLLEGACFRVECWLTSGWSGRGYRGGLRGWSKFSTSTCCARCMARPAAQPRTVGMRLTKLVSSTGDAWHRR